MRLEETKDDYFALKYIFLATILLSKLFASSTMRLFFKALLALGLMFLYPKSMYAQSDSILKNKQYLDSLIRVNMQEEMGKNIRQFREKQSYSISMEVFGHIRQIAGKAQEFLGKGLDTLKLEHEFEQIINYQRQSITGVFPFKDALPSYRNFVTTELLLGELITRLDIQYRSLKRSLTETELFRSQLDSLVTDTTIYHIPSMKDSVLFNDYMRELTMISAEITPVDNLINNSLRILRKLDQQASMLRKILLSNIKQCAQYREEQGQKLFIPELPVQLIKNTDTLQSLPQAASSSFVKSKLLLRFYVQNNSGVLVFIALLFITIALLLFILSRKLKTQQQPAGTIEGWELLNYPFSSAFFIAITAGQFLFRWPPLVFYTTIWLLAALAGTRVYIKSTRPALISYWLLFLLLFVIVSFDNLMLFYTKEERYFLLVIALFSLILSSTILIQNRKTTELRLLVIGLPFFLALFSFLSFLFNIGGYYNLSKLLLTAGYFGVLTGIVLFFVGKMINNWLNVASFAIKNAKNHINLNFNKENPAVPWILVLLLTVGWFLLFLRNFPFYRNISSSVRETLILERTIGNFSFTFSSILIFLLVLIASVIFSKLISLFSSNAAIQPGMAKSEKKGGINNWLLLIRITVITAGILLAFASAGIPMDKITIIIGSLGVGIGLGLQNIVGNLFSGIILAFERPFEIGDQIEVDNRRGRVKEMGFRSSRIITFEGSEVIIPNGDLLSHHVINYTLSNNFTRVELMVGVKYGSNLEKIKEVLEKMLSSNPHVRKHPAPQVLLHSFSNSSVDFRLLFWSDINIWVELKSEIILGVDKAFREAGIEIPFPQLDIHIISSPGSTNLKKDVSVNE